MIDAIISFFLRLWDRLRGFKHDSYEYIPPTIEETLKDPDVQHYLKTHRLRTPTEERPCLCGCGETMRVPMGSVQYCLKEHRAAFRKRARERDLLKFRFAHTRQEAERSILNTGL